jgi:hypothetical protein
MTLTTVTITGTFERENSQPSQGTITARLNHPLTNATENIENTPILGELNAEGKLVAQSGEPFTLVANDDSGTEPAGTVYQFALLIDTAPGTVVLRGDLTPQQQR